MFLFIKAATDGVLNVAKLCAHWSISITFLYTDKINSTGCFCFQTGLIFIIVHAVLPFGLIRGMCRIPLVI